MKHFGQACLVGYALASNGLFEWHFHFLGCVSGFP